MVVDAAGSRDMRGLRFAFVHDRDLFDYATKSAFWDVDVGWGIPTLALSPVLPHLRWTRRFGVCVDVHALLAGDLLADLRTVLGQLRDLRYLEVRLSFDNIQWQTDEQLAVLTSIAALFVDVAARCPTPIELAVFFSYDVWPLPVDGDDDYDGIDGAAHNMAIIRREVRDDLLAELLCTAFSAFAIRRATFVAHGRTATHDIAMLRARPGAEPPFAFTSLEVGPEAAFLLLPLPLPLQECILLYPSRLSEKPGFSPGDRPAFQHLDRLSIHLDIAIVRFQDTATGVVDVLRCCAPDGLRELIMQLSMLDVASMAVGEWTVKPHFSAAFRSLFGGRDMRALLCVRLRLVTCTTEPARGMAGVIDDAAEEVGPAPADAETFGVGVEEAAVRDSDEATEALLLAALSQHLTGLRNEAYRQDCGKLAVELDRGGLTTV